MCLFFYLIRFTQWIVAYFFLFHLLPICLAAERWTLNKMKNMKSLVDEIDAITSPNPMPVSVPSFRCFLSLYLQAGNNSRSLVPAHWLRHNKAYESVDLFQFALWLKNESSLVSLVFFGIMFFLTENNEKKSHFASMIFIECGA